MWSLVLLLLACKSETPETADQLVEGGTIYLDAVTTTDALALRDGIVLATGEEARTRVVAETRRVDLNGGTAYPGFIDSHTHTLPGSFVLERLLLLGVSSMDALKSRLADYASDEPDEPWLIGYGWVSGMLEDPSGVALDEIVSDRPVLLVNSSGHAALVNSRAMELAGITSRRPIPRGEKLFVTRSQVSRPVYCWRRRLRW